MNLRLTCFFLCVVVLVMCKNSNEGYASVEGLVFSQRRVDDEVITVKIDKDGHISCFGKTYDRVEFEKYLIATAKIRTAEHVHITIEPSDGVSGGGLLGILQIVARSGVARFSIVHSLEEERKVNTR